MGKERDMHISKDGGLTDRARGCLLGLAIGDAVGAPVEFKRPGTFEPLTDMVGHGTYSFLKAGQWTDDTSMAMCLAESLIECRQCNAMDQMQRYYRWYKDGYWSSTGRCFDIGRATREAIVGFARTGEPWATNTDERNSGNGSLMRVAPVALAYHHRKANLINAANYSSCVTHASKLPVEACECWVALLNGALNGLDKESLLHAEYVPLFLEEWGYGELYDDRIGEILKGSYKHKNPPEIEGTGFVLRCMEAALWAFYNTDNFKDGCLAAANLGDDSDSTAAVYGQIAGAYYGINGIPTKWRAQVWRGQEIEHYADALIAIR